MKRSLFLLLFAFCSLFATNAALSETWYIRADGGTRYSSNATAGQCDGKADAAYSGQGINQHCAFKDFRFLYDDQNSYNQLSWAISGGDTVIVDNTKQWRVGWDTDGTGGEAWCPGWNGGPYGCFNPTVPSGTAGQHTRILGRNWASCSLSNGQPDKSKMTYLFGGHGAVTTLNLTGAQYVDVQCMEITSHASCIRHGSPATPAYCSSSVPIDDYDGEGIITNSGTHDLLLQDLWIHGHTDRGIIGPIGGLVTANRVFISTNGMAGWDFDDGNSTPNAPNSTLKMNYSTIEFSGCNQQYPAVDTIPVASCYSQSTGGYGDGIGTPANDTMNVYIDHSVFRYNTQDGEDFGHIDTGANTLQITNSASYGNSGGQWKWGPNFTSVVFENNLAVANCLRMSQPLPGAPSTYNAHLGDFCRANDALSFNFRNGGNALFANNSIVTYAPTTFDIQCSDANCANTTFTLDNNIVVGYQNPTTWNMGGQVGGVGGFCGAGCNGSTALLGTIKRSNNIWYGFRGSCIANSVTDAVNGSSTGESCLDPQFNNEPSTFASESTLDSFDFGLTSSSPAKGAGIAVAGLASDYAGATWSVPPSAGALEFGSDASLLNLVGTITSALTSNTSSTSSTTTSSTSSTTSSTTSSSSSSTSSSSTSSSSSTTSSSGTSSSGTSSSGTSSSTGSSSTPSSTPSKVATASVLTAAKGPSTAYPLILTTTVSASGSSRPNGTVTLYSSSNSVIASGVLNSAGTVSWLVPSGLNGQKLHAVYTGTTAFASSTSNTINVAQAIASLK